MQGKTKMSGQKIIEASLLASVVFIIRQQYVKLIIYAQGTFCLCAFLKRQFPEQHFLKYKMSMTARQGKSGQNNIDASSSTSVLLIIRKQYERLVDHLCSRHFCSMALCAFLKRQFPE